MSKDTIQAIRITDQKAQYDEYAKWLLGRKIFLAHILEKTVDEFKGMNPKDIVPYIEGEPYISRVPVDAGLTNQIRKQSSETDHKPVSNIQKTDDTAYNSKSIHKSVSNTPKTDNTIYDNDSRIVGLNTEDSVVNEGVTRFDIIFYVRMKDGIAQIIVNLEAQQELPKTYHIFNRGVFYSSRMVSSQKGRDFFHSDYDSIKQVYSIWICMNMAENSMDHFYLTDKKLLGNYDWNYDKNLINIILIGLSNDLPKQSEEYELHRLLGTILSKKLSVTEKLDILEMEYDIKAEDDVKEVVGTMCNLSEGIWESGIREGEERGVKIGEARGIQIGEAHMILNMKQAGLALEQIAQIAKCSVEKIQQIVSENS